MPAPDAADLRAAALSDLRHPPTNANDAGLLAVLLPDVPGDPYGGYATRQQRQATSEVIARPVLADARPAHLRDLLRAWAESEAATRWEIRPYNTLHERTWVILCNHKAVAEAYNLDDARYILAALQSRGQDEDTELDDALNAHISGEEEMTVEQVSDLIQRREDLTGDLHTDAAAQRARDFARSPYDYPGEGDGYPDPAADRRGKDNAAGLRGTLQKLQTLDDNGRPTAAALQVQGYAVGAPEPGER